MGGKNHARSKSDSNKTRAQHHKHQRTRGRTSSKTQQVVSKESQKNQLLENLSFCGCGFLGIYHVGVASCFHEYAPQISMHKITGSSVGSIVAVAHICGNLQVAYALTDILRIAIDARARALGPLHPSFDISALIRDALERGLPDDVHLKVNNKLHISLTRVYDGQNVIISKFDSKEDVMQAIICSCFIPFWSGLIAPKYKGVAYIDGGFSNNLPILDDKTVTVSPFAGEADICPLDEVYNFFTINLSNTSFSVTPHNLYRLSYALLPPPPEILSELCQQGFADGVRYLQRMKLISCAKCSEIRSSVFISNGSEIIEQTSFSYPRQDSASSFEEQLHLTSSVETSSLDDNDYFGEEYCDGCVLRTQNASREFLPKQFTDRIREACDNVNKSLYNWFYSHRPIKYLSYLATPYYLPMNISLALFLKFLQRLPSAAKDIIKSVYDLKDILLEIVRSVGERSTTSMLMSPSDQLDLVCDDMKKNTSESSISVKITADCRRSSVKTLTTYECGLTIVLFGRQNLLSTQE